MRNELPNKAVTAPNTARERLARAKKQTGKERREDSGPVWRAAPWKRFVQR